MNPSPSISAAVADFVQSGLSITVAARNDRLVPSITRAVGCRVDADRRAITVMVFAGPSEALLRDIASNGHIAICFNRPSTHETVQLKGADAHSVRVTAIDLAAARRSLDLFAADVGPLGWDAHFVDTLLWRDPADLLAIRFTPQAAFMQTPGPRAGAELKD